MNVSSVITKARNFRVLVLLRHFFIKKNIVGPEADNVLSPAQSLLVTL